MATATPTTRRLTGPMSKRLLTARRDAGFSRRELAELIDVGEKTIYNYETPSYTRTRKSYIVHAWAAACHVPFESLWGTSGRELSRRACNGDTPRKGAISHLATAV